MTTPTFCLVCRAAHAPVALVTCAGGTEVAPSVKPVCYAPPVAALATPERTSSSVLLSGASPDRPGAPSTSGPGPEFFMRMGPKPRSAESRFWAKVNQNGPVHPVLGSACWLWTGKPTTSGYGTFAPIRTHKLPAHRYSFLLANGAIPDDLLVLHKCDVRACVRPDHLFAGTQFDNVRDMMAKGREGWTMKRRSHCVRGHSLDDAVPIMSGRTPSRRCRECKRLEGLAYYAKHRDRVLARQIRNRATRQDRRSA